MAFVSDPIDIFKLDPMDPRNTRRYRETSRESRVREEFVNPQQSTTGGRHLERAAQDMSIRLDHSRKRQKKDNEPSGAILNYETTAKEIVKKGKEKALVEAIQNAKRVYNYSTIQKGFTNKSLTGSCSYEDESRGG